MTSKLAVFRRQASIGGRVTLRLSDGRNVTGRVTALEDGYVSLDLGETTVTYFDDLLAGFEIHRGDHDGAGVEESNGSPSALEQPGKGLSQNERASLSHTSTADQATIDADADVLLELTKLRAAYSEALKRSRLRPAEPDFTFSRDDFPAGAVDEVRREWDRARNRYDYALKVKELSRLSDIVVQVLDPLTKRYPDSAAARALLGRVLLLLNRQAEAKDHLAFAAALADRPEDWLALASAAEDTALVCYALRRYFRLAPPWNSLDAWYCYLAVAIDHHDLREVTQIIDDWLQRKGENPHQLLFESLLYLLSSSGSESMARQVTASLVHETGELPIGWKESFDSARPSDELLDVERDLSRTPGVIPSQEPAKDGESTLYGRVTSFGNQLFGFITANEDRAFFFRIDDVPDDTLRQALLDGSWRTIGEVEFDVLAAGGHKYSRAANVMRRQGSEALLLRARDLLQASQYEQAMGIVRRVLSNDPRHEFALQLESKVKQATSRGQIALPAGSGPYARAKRAQLADRDLQTAERLLNQAIRSDDNRESAIKDLASLLQQQGRVAEAIVLLEEYSRDIDGISPYDNMLATHYQHAERHDDAIRILAPLTKATAWPRKGILLRRVAFSYFKGERYDAAEAVLRDLLANNPTDMTAERWLANLEDARRSGRYDDADEIAGDLGTLTEEGVELSSLARAAIDNCTYEGVNPEKLQKGSAGRKDAARVANLAKQLGTKRPRDRAAYYLTAAALLHSDPRDGDLELIYDYLRRYFASMADASWFEKRPADVVRSYYVESLTLVFDDNLYESWRSLLRYLASFAPVMLKDVEAVLPRRQDDRSLKTYTVALQRALTMIKPDSEAAWLDGLLTAGSQSRFARERIGDAVRADSDLTVALADLLDTTHRDAAAVYACWQSRCREHARAYRQRLSVCRSLTTYHATIAALNNLSGQLRKAYGDTTSEVDRTRLNALSDIADYSLAFCRAADFEEKQSNYLLVTSQAARIEQEISDAPTRYSHEGLVSISDHLKSLVEEEYAQTVRSSGADVRLELLVDEYHRTQDGELRLQVEVSNKRGCSPASPVRVSLGPEDSEYFATDRWEQEAAPKLRGGDAIVVQMAVRPQPAALEKRAFPIEIAASYRSLLGEDKRTEPRAWTVRLYRDEDFEHMVNPYAPFAEGGPVDDPNLFVGREALLSRLESSLLASPGSKSIVMFGQKRAGKSSLLEYLRRRLAGHEGVVPVCFSLQDIASELSIPALIHRILQGIADAIEELRFEGADLPAFSAPGIDALASHATLRFHDSMAALKRALGRCSSSPNFVLLVDEFTDVFKEIRNGSVPRQFMKAWKAIIEKRYFASVLVGQDIMPTFKEEFPNEFGVTEDVRVTYLDEAAAAKLVCQPVGEHHFVGNAVSRLLGLTARSPYYTMMFCARLVDYMNDTRSARVTEADIIAVKDQMLRGGRRLTRDKFDNLLCAGDGVVDSGIDPEHTYAVCLAIARGSENGLLTRERIRGFAENQRNELLADLERRDVVERKGSAYRLRVGLFRDWLLLQG